MTAAAFAEMTGAPVMFIVCCVLVFSSDREMCRFAWALLAAWLVGAFVLGLVNG